MDILSQGLLGAAMAQSSAAKHETRLATFIGFASGLLADVDFFIRSSSDTLLTLQYHRHFTHSLFFIPIGSAIAALLIFPIVKHKLSFKQVFIFSLLGYSLSGVLDACTSYGTHLLWPFTQSRISWYLISIIDPIFTIGILIFVFLAFKKSTAKYAHYGLIFALLYMALGWLQLQKAENIVAKLVSERGHQAERLIVKPTLGNRQLWRSIYQYDGIYYIDAVRLGITAPSRIYPGNSISATKIDKDFLSLKTGSVLYQDIQRFAQFTDNWIAMHPEKNILIDIRYSNLPTSLEPLWGIEMDFNNPDQHAKYTFYRNPSKSNRKIFMEMLLGKDIENL